MDSTADRVVAAAQAVLAARLRRYRKENDLTLRAAGRMAGVSFTTITRVENNAGDMALGTFLRICWLTTEDPTTILADARAVADIVADLGPGGEPSAPVPALREAALRAEIESLRAELEPLRSAAREQALWESVGADFDLMGLVNKVLHHNHKLRTSVREAAEKLDRAAGKPEPVVRFAVETVRDQLRVASALGPTPAEREEVEVSAACPACAGLGCFARSQGNVDCERCEGSGRT